MISDLDRAYKPECMHASPIAYGIKGYQLTASIFRNMLHHILTLSPRVATAVDYVDAQNSQKVDIGLAFIGTENI